MHLVLTGATGLVGSAVLDAMINMKEVSRISILSRRPVKMADDAKDARINVILHEDFAKYDAGVMAQLKGAEGCVWALGISQNAVSKDEYVKITKTYAVNAAEAFAKVASDEDRPFRFVFVSGDGATLKPGSLTPLFSRVKGETELALAELRRASPRLRANTVRPSFVDGAGHDAIASYVPVVSAIRQATASVLGPVFRATMSSRVSPTKPLGRFLAEMAAGKFDDSIAGPNFQKIGDFSIVNNPDFRKLAGLDS